MVRALPVRPGYSLICAFLAATPEPQTPGASSSQLPGGVEFAPIVVHIEYTLTHPVDGLQFVLPTESYPYVSKHDLSVSTRC